MPSNNRKKTRSKKKAAKKLDRALRQTSGSAEAEETVRAKQQFGWAAQHSWHVAAWLDSTVFKDSDTPNAATNFHANLESTWKEELSKHRDGWHRRCMEMKRIFYDASAPGSQELVESLASQLLLDVESFRHDVFIKVMGPLPPSCMGSGKGHSEMEVHALIFRGAARVNLDKYHEAIQDLTDALKCKEFLPASDVNQTATHLFILNHRAMAFAMSRQCDKARVDLDCVLQVARNREEFSHYWSKAQYLMAVVMAWEKLVGGHQRPHYTDSADQLATETRLGVGRCSPTYYFCYGCGKDKTMDGVEKLSLCSRCKQVHFCSKACQLHAWKDHKKECSKDLKCPVIVCDTHKDMFRACLGAKECGMAHAEGVGHMTLCMLVRDTSTDRLFDSLTDNDVYFSPSENMLIPPKDVLLYKKIESRVMTRFAYQDDDPLHASRLIWDMVDEKDGPAFDELVATALVAGNDVNVASLCKSMKKSAARLTEDEPN